MGLVWPLTVDSVFSTGERECCQNISTFFKGRDEILKEEGGGGIHDVLSDLA